MTPTAADHPSVVMRLVGRSVAPSSGFAAPFTRLVKRTGDRLAAY